MMLFATASLRASFNSSSLESSCIFSIVSTVSLNLSRILCPDLVLEEADGLILVGSEVLIFDGSEVLGCLDLIRLSLSLRSSLAALLGNVVN